ncbi:hypothetical protein D9M70_496420 [compost metagenome]
MVENPGQSGAVGKIHGHRLGLAQALLGLAQLVLLQQQQPLAEVTKQFVEVARGARRPLVVQMVQTPAGGFQLSPGQLDLAEEQLQQVGVAAEAEALQLLQSLGSFAVRLGQLAEGE